MGSTQLQLGLVLKGGQDLDSDSKGMKTRGNSITK